jgi:hypothetical protein
VKKLCIVRKIGRPLGQVETGEVRRPDPTIGISHNGTCNWDREASRYDHTFGKQTSLQNVGASAENHRPEYNTGTEQFA